MEILGLYGDLDTDLYTSFQNINYIEMVCLPLSGIEPLTYRLQSNRNYHCAKGARGAIIPDRVLYYILLYVPLITY